MLRGHFEVQVVDRTNGTERWLRVQASSADEAGRKVTELGEVVGSVRLIEVIEDDPRVRENTAWSPSRNVSNSKSPSAAAILNFFFWGAGYLYAGRMWGLAILIPDILLSFASCLSPQNYLSPGILLIWIILGLPASLAFAWHGYRMVVEDQSAARTTR